MKTFVINLKRSPDRRANIEKQLQTLEIDYEIIEATDGRELTAEEITNLYNEKESLKYFKQPLLRDAIACADSHLRVYNQIINDGLAYAFIVEDDVILDPRINDILRDDFLNKQNFDWLQIDYCSTGLHFLKNWLRSSLVLIKKNPVSIFYIITKFPYIFFLSLYEGVREKVLAKNPQIVVFARPLYLTSAYIITNAGANKLLSLGRPIRFTADMLPNKARIMTSFKMRAVSPKLATPDLRFESIGA